MIVKRAILILGLIGLVGCSNTPVNVGKAEQVKAEKQFAYKTPINGGAEVTFIRDSGFIGSGCDYLISINGIKGASLGAGEKVTLNLPQGDAKIQGTFECPIGAPMKTTLTLPVLSGVSSYVRINTTNTGGAVTLEETSSDNPAFTCPLLSKSYDTSKAWAKQDMINFMRQTADLTSILRNKARGLSVKYNDETLNSCLLNSSADLKRMSATPFAALKEKASSDEEKTALIDAYSKYLSVIDPTMSINQIDMIKASFSAAVNKYELL